MNVADFFYLAAMIGVAFGFAALIAWGLERPHKDDHRIDRW